MPDLPETQQEPHPSACEVLVAFLKLGLLSFGGPVAHLGYFHREFIERRGWLSECAYADIVALSQFLPGPASSQVGFTIGLLRSRLLGGLAAWFGFTLPSALLMLLFAYGTGGIATSRWGAGALHGLMLTAVAIVAQAVFGMARRLAPDKPRASIAACAFVLMMLAPGSAAQIGTIVLGGLAGVILCRAEIEAKPDGFVMPVSRRLGILCLGLFFLLLARLRAGADGALALFDTSLSFRRARL